MAAALAAAVAAALGALLLAPGGTEPHGDGPAAASSSFASAWGAAERWRPPGVRMDQALLLVRNELPEQGLRLLARCGACHRCSYQLLAVLPPRGDGGPGKAVVVVDTQHPLSLLLSGSLAGSELCKIQYHFGEFGNYSLMIKTLSTSNKTVSCDVVINEGPINSYLPILFAFLVYMGILAILITGRLVMKIDPVRNWVYKKLNPRETDRLINSELGSPNTTDSVSSDPAPRLWSATSRQRLRSLDTFRGLSLIIMVFVNYGGGKYWFFKHESWNGKVQRRQLTRVLATAISRYGYLLQCAVA